MTSDASMTEYAASETPLSTPGTLDAADQPTPDTVLAQGSSQPQPAAPRAPRPAATGSAGATGRRKEAVARVRLFPGTGRWIVNGKDLEEYFPNKVHQQLVREPFTTLEVAEQYDVIARVTGGGVSGQAGALRLGIARALTITDDGSRPTLKKAGFLTRDARVKERRKYGLKKARKAPQYSKR